MMPADPNTSTLRIAAREEGEGSSVGHPCRRFIRSSLLSFAATMLRREWVGAGFSRAATEKRINHAAEPPRSLFSSPASFALFAEFSGLIPGGGTLDLSVRYEGLRGWSSTSRCRASHQAVTRRCPMKNHRGEITWLTRHRCGILASIFHFAGLLDLPLAPVVAVFRK